MGLRHHDERLSKKHGANALRHCFLLMARSWRNGAFLFPLRGQELVHATFHTVRPIGGDRWEMLTLGDDAMALPRGGSLSGLNRRSRHRAN
jgi:hypothetical protein